MVWISTASALFPDGFWGNPALSVSCLWWISSVTGAAAFNELNQRCWCFACSFRAGSLWADQSWWGQRDTGFTLSVPFKKRKTHSICSLCSLKNQHFPEFHARFENKTFWEVLSAVRCSQWVWPCVRWEGMLFAPSPLSCGLVSSCTSSQSYPMFLFKAEISALSKPPPQPDELEKEHVSLWPAVECWL